MIFDSHMHTRLSYDSSACIDHMAEAASRLGLGAVITEHCDYDMNFSPGQKLDGFAYFREYASKRSDSLLLGVEIGLSALNTERNKALVERHPFDFVLGSMHMLNNDGIYIQFRTAPATTSYAPYLQATIEALDFNKIDALGHIDYPSRVGLERDILYCEYGELYDKLFAKLVNLNILMEVNTRRLYPGRDHANDFRLLQRYYELGGRYVTIGSDAHWPEGVGKNFAAALKMINEAGLKTVYFKERKMILY